MPRSFSRNVAASSFSKNTHTHTHTHTQQIQHQIDSTVLLPAASRFVSRFKVKKHVVLIGQNNGISETQLYFIFCALASNRSSQSVATTNTIRVRVKVRVLHVLVRVCSGKTVLIDIRFPPAIKEEPRQILLLSPGQYS